MPDAHFTLHADTRVYRARGLGRTRRESADCNDTIIIGKKTSKGLRMLDNDMYGLRAHRRRGECGHHVYL